MVLGIKSVIFNVIIFSILGLVGYTLALVTLDAKIPEHTVIDTPTTKHFRISSKDALCLKQNVHYEADGEPFRGKVAVAMVTLNRRNLTNKSVCEIVFEPWQFSWTTTKKKWLTNFSDDVNFAVEVAVKGYNLIEELKTATYFHEAYTYPAWASEKRKITSIGNHIFYSEK